MNPLLESVLPLVWLSSLWRNKITLLWHIVHVYQSWFMNGFLFHCINSVVIALSMRVSSKRVCTNREIEVLTWFGASAGELDEDHVPWHAWFVDAHLQPERPKCSSVVRLSFNSLFLGYIKNQKMEDLRKAIATMKEREISPTNLSLQTIISGLLEYQQIDDLLAYLPDLKATGNVLSFNVMEKLMHALVDAGQMDAVTDALHLMKVNGLQPSQRTWDLVLQKYASLGEYEKLLQLLEELKDVGVTASAVTYSQLLKQVWESEKAVKLLDDLTDTVPAV